MYMNHTKTEIKCAT